MPDIIVNNHTISTSVLDILLQARSELTNGKLSIIKESGEDIQCCCPIHKNGLETRPSCYVRKSDGVFHCFTDGQSGGLVKFIAECFDETESQASKWLIDNFSDGYIQPIANLTPIILTKETIETKLMDESILSTFEDYHPYMTQRHLTDQVIKEFQIKYEPATKCIVFPVRDKFGRLVALTKRSVESKKFIIDKDFNKKNIYLLDNVIKNNSKEVYITESQINCLTLRGYGYNALAMFGAGCTDEQIAELNKTGVMHFILALDNDDAGLKGTKRLCQYITKNKFVDVIQFKDQRDVNDLTKEEFDSLEKIDRTEYLRRYYGKRDN